jgi:hypothetical protein
MAQFLMLHTYDPKTGRSDRQMDIMKAITSSFTTDTYCIASWLAPGAGKIACLWEAPSEQAIIDAYSEDVDIPVDGIFPAMVVDWAETKKSLAGQ